MRKRKAPRNKRPIKKQKLIKVILIEGETEINYINYLKSLYNLNYQVKFVKRSKLGNNIKKTIDKFKLQFSISDSELLLLYDLENNSKEYKKFIVQDSLVHENTYLTQPCIEYHFLLHHKNFISATNKYRSCKETEKELLEHLPKYKKGNSFVWDDSDVGLTEVILAKKRSIDTFTTFKQLSFSTVGKLIRDHFANEKTDK